MQKTKEEFVVFVRQAINDRKSVAYNELYNFLVHCFVRADTNMNGQVAMDTFGKLIDEAAELPRLYGYAPKAHILYPSSKLKEAARITTFNEIDTNNVGYITLEQWVGFAVEHIVGKVSSLPKDYLGGSTDDVSKEEFIEFMKMAVDKSSPEYRELYHFLLKTFQAGDVQKVGKIDLNSFDKMIEAAANAPRRFGLAPKTSQMFQTDADRLKKRKEYFQTMDLDHNNMISFDEWLRYAYDHIVKKVATLS